MKLLISIIAMLFCSMAYAQKAREAIVKSIPYAPLFNIQGDTTNLLDLAKGKVTFIDFWFIPCGPCFEEMTMLHTIYDTYKSNNNFVFLTITFSDSSFVRDLIENRNTENNEVYDYFKTLTKLDSFRLPVYFTKGYASRMKVLKRNSNGQGFSGSNWPFPKETNASPNRKFGFVAYPTVLIFDKAGKLLYNKTGYTNNGELKEIADIKRIIDAGL